MKGFLKWFGIGLVLLVVIVFLLLAVNSILPPEWSLSVEILLLLASAVLSIMFTYLPSLRTQFAALNSAQKSTVNLALVILLSVVIFVGTCTSIFTIPGIECTQTSLRTLAIYIFLAAGGNQLAYVASPQPVDVTEAKLERIQG